MDKPVNISLIMTKVKRRTTWVPEGIRREDFSDVPQQAVINAICQFFAIGEEEIKAKNRAKTNVNARTLAAYLMTLNERLSLKDIALACGFSNHSSVLWARNNVEDWSNLYHGYFEDLTYIFEILRIKKIRDAN